MGALTGWVHCPGGGPIIAADDDAGNTVVQSFAGSFHPELTPRPAAGKILNKIKRLGQNVVGGNRDHWRYIQPDCQISQVAPHIT